jgi:Ca2+-transporting ATPase
MKERVYGDQLGPYEQAAEDVAARLGSDTRVGLSSTEAQVRLGRTGPNELDVEVAAPAWRQFLAQFKDALVLLLVAAAAISCVVWAVERDTSLPYEGLVIATIVLLNAILGFVQEGRAEKALAALRSGGARGGVVGRRAAPRRSRAGSG